MKNYEEFEELENGFAKKVKGKKEGDFLKAVYEFMQEQKFKNLVIKLFLECEDAKMVYITDDIDNEYGIWFMEAHYVIQRVFAASEDAAEILSRAFWKLVADGINVE